MGIDPVRWTPEQLRNAPVLSNEERELIAKKMAALDLVLNDRNKAKYKLEVRFSKSRSMYKPTPGLLSFWESGKKLHGGGDAKVYLCPGKHIGVNDCEAVIPESANIGGRQACAKCGMVWKSEDVIGELGFNLPMKKWAEVLVRYYVLMDHNADIYVKHSLDDIRTAALQDKLFKRGEDVQKIRNRRALHIYPLRHIINDVSNGSDILTRFYSFLVS